jgi:hypothetical protein
MLAKGSLPLWEESDCKSADRKGAFSVHFDPFIRGMQFALRFRFGITFLEIPSGYLLSFAKGHQILASVLGIELSA